MIMHRTPPLDELLRQVQSLCPTTDVSIGPVPGKAISGWPSSPFRYRRTGDLPAGRSKHDLRGVCVGRCFDGSEYGTRHSGGFQEALRVVLVALTRDEIGRASGRERVCQYV